MPEKAGIWKRIAKGILNLPYTLLFNRITPAPVRTAFFFKGEEAGNAFCRNAKWEDYYFNTCGKRIITLGVADAFDEVVKYERKMIECGIDWSGKYVDKRVNGIQIFPPTRLETLSRHENYAYLITATKYNSIQTAAELLEEHGIYEYYSYAAMECRRPKYFLSRPAYCFLRFKTFLIHKDGFFPNIVKFYLKMLACKLGVRSAGNSYKKMKELKNRHKGQRCFIIATGPSLTVSDVELLKDEITFGVNSIYGLFSQTDWRPTYYTMVDFKAFLDHKAKGTQLDFESFCQKEYFITDRIYSLAGLDEHDMRAVALSNSYLDHMVFGEHLHMKYRKDISLGLYNATTVVNSCINIAHYMGFSEIYLLGVDCNYKLPKQYFDDKKNWLAINLERATMVNSIMQAGFAYFKRVMDKYGVKVFNATRGGQLEVFPRVCLEEVLGKN